MSKSKKVSTKNVADFRQLYNKDWELLPIFQDWLSPVKGSNFRAICKFCSKEFRAHRTDLRVHARSNKHKKAAINFYESKQNKETYFDTTISKSTEIIALSESLKPVNSHSQITENLEDEVHCITTDTCEAYSSSAPTQLPKISPPRVLGQRTEKTDTHSIICTKVEDTVKGVPVDRLVVYLFALQNNEWTKFGKGITARDGRCTRFVMLQDDQNNTIVPGQYKLRYETKMHFTLNLDESIFPHIEVSIEVLDITDSYHVHLLISPFGFMVFRNSFT